MYSPDILPPRHFRDVLGQLPTGVVAITSRSADGEPIGMTLGSFTSVSLNPPLVGFLPDRSSSTFPRIKETGRFCANILASDQKNVSQAFATRGADRFAGVEWHPSPRTGSPILTGSLAWVDCEIAAVHEAGDHDIVIGRVLDLDMAPSGVPLVYFQGGYGTFTLRSLVLATRGALNEAARLADKLRPDLEDISAEFDLECRVFARHGDELVVVMTTGYNGSADRVGMVLPFCPPFGLTFVAWGARELRDRWYESARGTLSVEHRHALEAELDRIRSQGWSAAFANGPLNVVGGLLEEIAEYGSTPRLERRLLEAGRLLTEDLGRVPDLDAGSVDSVRSITVPLLRDGAPVLHVVARGFQPGMGLTAVTEVRERLLTSARAVWTLPPVNSRDEGTR